MNTSAPTTPVNQASSSARRKSLNSQSVGVVLLSVAIGAVGQLVMKMAVNQLGKLELSLPMLMKMASSPVLIIAVGLYGLSALLWLLALRHAELSFAYPFLSLTYIVALVGGAVFFHDQITPLRVLGFFVIMCGLVVISLAERPSKVPEPTVASSNAEFSIDSTPSTEQN